VGDTVTYREAWHLVSSLMADPTSWLQAAVSGWSFPVTREWMIAADKFDMDASAATPRGRRRPKAYPRPWPDKKVTKLGGKNGKRRTAAEVIAILRPST
jgi:hypothetical protein